MWNTYIAFFVYAGSWLQDIIRIIAQEKRNECQERRYHALLEYDQLRTSQEKREAFFGFGKHHVTLWYYHDNLLTLRLHFFFQNLIDDLSGAEASIFRDNCFLHFGKNSENYVVKL